MKEMHRCRQVTTSPRTGHGGTDSPLDAQQYAPRIRPYKKTRTCMCFCTLRNGREAVASISTAYGG